MAMGGGFKRKSKVASEIPDSSLADIAFLLLIFFMVSTTFRRERPREVERPEAAMLDFLRARSGNPEVGTSEVIARSERDSGYRNIALANFIRSYGNLVNDVDAVLDFYYLQCSLLMDCVDIARSMHYLANRGQCGISGERVTSEENATRINSLMMTAGTYDAAGDFAFYVGLPAKSGVAGGIAAVVPNVMGVCVWSPGLDDKGNSQLGRYALHRFTRMTGLSVF